jgi:hypothetical protein
VVHPALRLLIKLNIRGWLRRMSQRLSRPRGVLNGLFLLLMLGSWVVVIVFSKVSGALEKFEFVGDAAAEVLPLALMVFSFLIVVKSSGESAIIFSPSEIDFLFSGPFSRRELLVFKLSTSILMLLFVSLMFSLFLAIFAEMWIAAFMGTFLSFLLLQLLGMAVALIGQTVSDQIHTRTRRAIAAIVLALLAVGVVQGLQLGMQQDVWQSLRDFRESWAGMVLLAPFEVFSRTILAERLFPDLLLWGGLALTIDLVLVAVVLRLDSNYLEASVALSQKMYRRIERMQRGGLLNMLDAPSAVRWSLPRFPWMGGSGPIAWRQLTVLMRGSRRLLMLVAAFVVTVIVVVMVAQNTEGGAAPSMIAIGLMCYLTFFAAILFPHELDHIDWLKVLPLSSTAIAWGELSGVVSILAVLQSLFFCVVAVLVPESAVIVLVAVVFTVPIDLVVFATENLIFLLYPSRVVSKTPGDLQHMGRNMVSTMMKSLVIFFCIGIAAGFGGIAYVVTGLSWITFAAVSWVVLSLEGLGLIHLNAWAFRRFDPSVDTPP